MFPESRFSEVHMDIWRGFQYLKGSWHFFLGSFLSVPNPYPESFSSAILYVFEKQVLCSGHGHLEKLPRVDPDPDIFSMDLFQVSETLKSWSFIMLFIHTLCFRKAGSLKWLVSTGHGHLEKLPRRDPDPDMLLHFLLFNTTEKVQSQFSSLGNQTDANFPHLEMKLMQKSNFSSLGNQTNAKDLIFVT